MNCPTCQSEARRFGKDRDGNQRYQCVTCRKTFSDRPARPLGTMRIDLDKALVCLHHLIEGTSVRATMRLTGTNRNTILDLLALMGERCERLLEGRIEGTPVLDVQCDEIWGFVGCKEKTRQLKGKGEEFGDAWCFAAIERTSKLVLAWHLGKRTTPDTFAFAEKVAIATSGRFQLTTDGFASYKAAIPATMPDVDFATLVKMYGKPYEEVRYSPPVVVDTVVTPRNGNPELKRVCTSHIERQNLTIRMQNRRMTRLTNAFSKKWENHGAALALHFAYYNFCRVHSTLKMTPAMAAGLEDHPWTLKELVEKSTQG